MTQTGKKRGFGNAVLLLTAAIWGLAFAFQRDAMTSGVGPHTFSAIRMLMAAASVWCFVCVSRIINRGKPRDLGLAKDEAEYVRNTVKGGFITGFIYAAAAIVQQVGIVYTSAGKAGFLTALYIVAVPVISTFLLGKRYSRTVWIGVVLGLFGLYLLSVTGDFTIQRGDILVILSALLFAFQILSIDRYVVMADPILFAAIEMSVGALVSFVLMLLFEEPSLRTVIANIGAIAYAGVMSGGVAYTLQMIGQKHTEPTMASLLMSFESVFAVIGGMILLNERMSIREIAGCIVMFAAVIMVQLPGPSAGGRKEG